MGPTYKGKGHLDEAVPAQEVEDDAMDEDVDDDGKEHADNLVAAGLQRVEPGVHGRDRQEELGNDEGHDPAHPPGLPRGGHQKAKASKAQRHHNQASRHGQVPHRASALSGRQWLLLLRQQRVTA